jgi:predicted RNA binding protein YcfA (HicA-like mRNA interferase family)
MNGYYQAVVSVLKEHGYSFLRPAGGSHEMWSNGRRKQTLSRNMPSRDMANKIMKQAGINHKF